MSTGNSAGRQAKGEARGRFLRTGWFLLLALPSAVTLAQPSLPGERQPLVPIPSLESQRAGFEAYQRCVAMHRREVDLHHAARDVIDFRDRRAAIEAALANDPKLRERFPGGIEQITAAAFARYRSFGGPAASVAEVQPVPTPCAPPGPTPPQRAAGGAPPLMQSRTLVLPPDAKPPGAPPPAPVDIDLQTRDPATQMEIARRYRHSTGRVPEVPDRFAEAMKWYRKAADQGYTPAMREIGGIYASGSRVRPDYAEAERWFRRAAELGDVEAMVALGRLLTPERPYLRRRDEAEATRWFRKAAEQGHALGMYHYAESLQHGRGVPMDKEAALDWYRRAAQNGNVVAGGWVTAGERCRKMAWPLKNCM